MRLFLCIYLRRLEAAISAPIVEEAIVMDIGETTVDVYIPRYALDRRVFLQDSNVGQSTVDVRRTGMTVAWLTGAYEMPGGARGGDALRQTKDANKNTTSVWREGSLGKTVRIKILQHIHVRLCVEGRSPLDVKAYLVHPDHVPREHYEEKMKAAEAALIADSREFVGSQIEEAFEDADS